MNFSVSKIESNQLKNWMFCFVSICYDMQKNNKLSRGEMIGVKVCHRQTDR